MTHKSLRLEPALRVASPIACSSWCPPSHLDDGSGGLDAAPSTLLVPAPWARASYLNALRRRRRSGALRLPRRHGRYHPTLRVRQRLRLADFPARFFAGLVFLASLRFLGPGPGRRVGCFATSFRGPRRAWIGASGGSALCGTCALRVTTLPMSSLVTIQV